MQEHYVKAWAITFHSAFDGKPLELVGQGISALNAEIHVLVGRALQGRNDLIPRTAGLELVGTRRAFGELLTRAGGRNPEAGRWLAAVLAANKGHDFNELLHHAVKRGNDGIFAPQPEPGKLSPSQALLALCVAAEAPFPTVELMEARDRGTALICHQVRAMCDHWYCRNAIDTSERLLLQTETA